MSGHHDDEREISPDAEQYNASLVRRVDETDDLAYFWVRFDGEPTPFQPGQYMTTGVYAEGKLEQRPSTSWASVLNSLSPVQYQPA